jgi:hypothetical protein
MKVYFCRDADGEASTWRYKRTKPVLCKETGTWGISSNPCRWKSLITDTTDSTFEKFGKGFHGVRKGQMKLLDLKPKIRGIVLKAFRF